MSKIGIIYFSGTGNTKFIAQNIKRQLDKCNEKVDLINIEKDDIDSMEYGYIIIGGPVYVDRYPENLIKYIEENLHGFRGKCMLFTTQASPKETITYQYFMKRIPSLNITYCTLFNMPNNFYNFLFKMSSKEEEIELMKRAQFSIEDEVNSFMEGKTKFYPKKKNIHVNMMNSVYNMVYPHLMKILTKKIYIDERRCTKCKLCERRCPMGAINIEEKNIINKNCLLCQRCLSSCPQDAFYYKDKKIIQYNPNFRYFNRDFNNE